MHWKNYVLLTLKRGRLEERKFIWQKIEHLSIHWNIIVPSVLEIPWNKEPTQCLCALAIVTWASFSAFYGTKEALKEVGFRVHKNTETVEMSAKRSPGTVCWRFKETTLPRCSQSRNLHWLTLRQDILVKTPSPCFQRRESHFNSNEHFNLIFFFKVIDKLMAW